MKKWIWLVLLLICSDRVCASGMEDYMVDLCSTKSYSEFLDKLNQYKAKRVPLKTLKIQIGASVPLLSDYHTIEVSVHSFFSLNMGLIKQHYVYELVLSGDTAFYIRLSKKCEPQMYSVNRWTCQTTLKEVENPLYQRLQKEYEAAYDTSINLGLLRKYVSCFAMEGQGYSGERSDILLKTEEFAAKNDQESLGIWLRSDNPYLQLFAVHGFNLISEKDVPVKQEFLEIIDYVSKSKSECSVIFCSGCLESKVPLKMFFYIEIDEPDEPTESIER